MTNDFNRFDTPASPFKEALVAITGKEPPFDLTGIYESRHISDDIIDDLQAWCADNSNPHWATGLSMLEAADLIVDGAIENANIATPDSNIDNDDPETSQFISDNKHHLVRLKSKLDQIDRDFKE